MRHNGRRVLITGAAKGIGAAVAKYFLEEGAKLYLADLPETGLADTAAALGATGSVLHSELNVTDTQAVEQAVAKMSDAFGGVDVVVNSAGIVAVVPALEESQDNFRKVMDVNVTGTWNVSQAAAKRMIAQGGGSIVNISSVYGFQGAPLRTAYCASKGAVIALTNSLAVEWGPHGIRVNSVAPTGTRTPMVQNLIERKIYNLDGVTRKTPLGRLAEPEEIAFDCGFLVGDEAKMISGHHLHVDGGWLANGYPT